MLDRVESVLGLAMGVGVVNLLYSPGMSALFVMWRSKYAHSRDKRATLHYTTLHYTTPHHTALSYTTLHCTALHCLTLHYTALHCTALQYTTLFYSTLYYTTVYCTVLLSCDVIVEYLRVSALIRCPAYHIRSKVTFYHLVTSHRHDLWHISPSHDTFN